MSWNSIYSANSKWIRNSFATDIHTLVRNELLVRGYGVQKTKNYFKNKVDIDIVAYFTNRPLDSDNIPAKLYIDGLKDYLIANDGYKYVGKVSTESVLTEGKDRIEITITERR